MNAVNAATPSQHPVPLESPFFGNSAVVMPLAASAGLPRLELGSEPVTAGQHLAKGGGFWGTIGWMLVIGSGLMLMVGTLGLALFGLAFVAFVAWLTARKARAYIRGSCVQVSSEQLPEIHEVVEALSSRLGLKEVPEVYLAEDNVANALTVKLGRRNLLILTDDMVWGALASPNPRALAFVIGHELAHIALGHTGLIRSAMRAGLRPLARIDELSADNVALALVGDRDAAVQALTLLTVGPQLMKYLSTSALTRQAAEVSKARLTRKAERNLTHPVLLRRVHNVVTSSIVS